MTESMHRTLVVTKLPRSVPPLLSAARAIVAAMSGNPSFLRPDPTLATVTAAILALNDAETALQSKTRGTRAARDERRRALRARLDELRLYVQRVANADPENAVAIIESAGMSVKRRAVQVKPPFAVKAGSVSGSVALRAIAAGDRARYEWQSSLDRAEWRDASATNRANTVIANLIPGKTYWFRIRIGTPEGQGDWSTPVSSVVT
jgi:hypothetical protein